MHKNLSTAYKKKTDMIYLIMILLLMTTPLKIGAEVKES
jgi:hypothetical protein